ncbi:hypothetical protein FHS43_001221 [Streptosporangium becharense]|uniref:Uncharacterized protein n=1 Tax=Streptosporangium becharense TaxID=1816182 RepID=A0A7W9MFR8_9ACTN|nr:hypothetical protein [Streptosporangium becharense]MBB2909975.1 hypothetical protein [Streptosporangium becharense]MBB5819070.1 hypothetical protein [Streptosporangium becharense]
MFLLGVSWLVLTPLCLWNLFRGGTLVRLTSVLALVALEGATVWAGVQFPRPGPVPVAASPTAVPAAPSPIAMPPVPAAAPPVTPSPTPVGPSRIPITPSPAPASPAPPVAAGGQARPSGGSPETAGAERAERRTRAARNARPRDGRTASCPAAPTPERAWTAGHRRSPCARHR